MKAIYKYTFMVDDTVAIPTHKIEKILRVESISDNLLALWAIVDPETKPDSSNVIFRIFGTGHEIKDISNFPYFTTVFDGPFVWHLFGGIQS
jgi:hypothetical protein